MSGCTFDIKLKPKAKRDSVKLSAQNTLEVAVTSAPIENKANDHLIRLLADTLRVPKSSIQIIRGGHSKNKAVSIDAMDCDEVIGKLSIK